MQPSASSSSSSTSHDVATETTRVGATTTTRQRGAARARRALVDAAVRLLPERAPSTISGRELAAEAGVNYGLIHHYFGGKDAVLRAGLVALRTDFVDTHDDVGSLPLLTEDAHPYLRALVRSQLDQPYQVAADGEYPLGRALVALVSQRLASTRPDADAPDIDSEAKARVIAMVSMQLCYSVFGPALLDATEVGHRERPTVETALAELYDDLALVPSGEGA